jgi:hypothetical protein
MINEQVVRGLVSQTLSIVCIAPRYDMIEVVSIQDCDGLSFKFWVKYRDHTVVEGQCYPHLYGDENSQDPVVHIYRITCPRKEPAAEFYQAWFDGERLTRKFHGDQSVPLSR